MTPSKSLTPFLVVGAVALFVAGCGERKAIEAVQKAKTGTGLFAQSWKEIVEKRPMADSTAQEWTWSATQSQAGLERGEWFVSYRDKSGSGYFWIARPDTGAVIFLNADKIASFRVNHLQEATGLIKVAVTEQGFFRCGTGDANAWCFHVVGTATNVSQPLVKARAEFGLIVKVGDRTEEGRKWTRIEKALPAVSEGQPWETGVTYPFEYWSNAIPDVYARTTGEALVYLDVVTSSLTWADVNSSIFVSKVAWPPTPNADGRFAQVPTMVPPDFLALPQYQYTSSNAKAFCREEWTKRGELNGMMFEYCLGQEREGYSELRGVLKQFGKNEWMATLFPAVWMEWTRQGITQYRMVGYNLKQQADAFLDYQYAKKGASHDGRKMAECESQWAEHASRWTMTMHCYEN